MKPYTGCINYCKMLWFKVSVKLSSVPLYVYTSHAVVDDCFTNCSFLSIRHSLLLNLPSLSLPLTHHSALFFRQVAMVWVTSPGSTPCTLPPPAAHWPTARLPRSANPVASLSTTSDRSPSRPSRRHRLPSRSARLLVRGRAQLV